jgi:molecular chaperone GrpE
MPANQWEGNTVHRSMKQENLETQKIPETNSQEDRSDANSDAKEIQEMTKEEPLDKLEELRETSQKNFDLYLRSQAEIENVKKRHKKEKEDWLKYANESLIRDLLPSLDNLEKALAHANSENPVHALREGVELTLKGLKDALAKSGLEEVPAHGEAFDPCFHEAVAQIEDDQVKPGTIVEELQKGYLLNKRLIRPAMVVVSKTGSSQSVEKGESRARACKKKH